MSRIPVNASLLALAVIAMVGICSQGVSGAANNCDIYVPTVPTGQTGPAYTTLALAVTAASNGDVICVAAGVYNFAYFNLATKGLTLQGAQAGVDARTRTAARDWVTGPYPAGETVFTHDGGHFVTIVGGLGATVDGIFMPNIGERAFDNSHGSSAAGTSDVTSLTIKNSVLKKFSGTGNGIIQFTNAGAGNNVLLEQNYIETRTSIFLYDVLAKANNWIIRNNEIRSYHFSFGPFVGDTNGYPGGIVIENNLFHGDIPNFERVASPTGYDGYAFNGILGNALIRGNTFTKMRHGLGRVWLYDAVVEGNTFSDNYLRAMALWDSDGSKPASSNVQIKNNVIEYNGTPDSLSHGIFMSDSYTANDPKVDASTIHIQANKLINLGASSSTDVGAIFQNGDNSADAIGNYWGASAPSDIRVVQGLAVTSPWIKSYQDDTSKAGSPGFWPVDVVFGAPAEEPVPTPTGIDVTTEFAQADGAPVATITFESVTSGGVTEVTPVAEPSPSIAPTFALGTPPVYYEITTTAAFGGQVLVCIAYAPTSIPGGKIPALYHLTGGAWNDITDPTKSGSGSVCGYTESFSPFAVGYVPDTYTCGEDLLAKDTECTQGFYFNPAGKYTMEYKATCAVTSYLNNGAAPTGCVKAGVAQCCYQRTCEQTDAVGNTFCPYGYQLKKTSYCTTNDQGVRTCEGPSDINPANSNINTALTVNTCCERIVQVASAPEVVDATNAAFPRCNSVNSGGALTGVQASTQDDTNWRLQDENSFLRTVDIYQGMCFSVTIDNDCTAAESLIKPTCCTRKVPTYVQFKIPTETGVTEDDGDQINNVRANTMRLDNLRKCALRYGRHITPARSFKPINNWLTVPPVGANTGDARFINIPITFGRGARQATVCIYTNNFRSTEGNVDCTWQSLCGYGAGGSVPTEAGNYMKGCEMRLVGRNSPTSTPCCSPVYSIESVDFFPAGANATVAKPFKVVIN